MTTEAALSDDRMIERMHADFELAISMCKVRTCLTPLGIGNTQLDRVVVRWLAEERVRARDAGGGRCVGGGEGPGCGFTPDQRPGTICRDCFGMVLKPEERQ